MLDLANGEGEVAVFVEGAGETEDCGEHDAADDQRPLNALQRRQIILQTRQERRTSERIRQEGDVVKRWRSVLWS
jgi:hypothetical protein